MEYTHREIKKHTHAHTHTLIHTCMHACMHACMPACVHACVHACIHAHMHTCTHAHMHTCIHACIYTYICTCTHAQALAHMYRQSGRTQEHLKQLHYPVTWKVVSEEMLGEVPGLGRDSVWGMRVVLQRTVWLWPCCPQSSHLCRSARRKADGRWPRCGDLCSG